MRTPEQRAADAARKGRRYVGVATLPTLTRRLERVLADAPADAWAHGPAWYDTFRAVAERLAERFDVDVDTAAAVLAITSPRVSVETNVRLTRDLLATHAAGGNVHALTGLSERIAAAADYLAGDRAPVDLDADGKLTPARKVRSFYRNILGDTDAVTVDTWAARAVGAREDRQVTGGAYVAIAEAYRRVARRYGVTPRDLQAIVWVAVRGTDQAGEWSTIAELADAPANVAPAPAPVEFDTPV